MTNRNTKEYRKKYRKANLEKENKQSRDWNKKNTKSIRNSRLKKYGITEDDYIIMFLEQNKVCAICGKSPKNNKRLCVDHDHKTGKVRGLLCMNCNVAIGLLKEKKDNLINAINYLF